MMQRTLRHSTPLWQRHIVFAGLFFVLVLGALMPQNARASTEEFTIVAVGISDNTNTAKDMAMDYARKRAVFLAVRKLGVTDPEAAILKFSPSDIDQIIRGSNVEDTKREGDHLYEKITVTIVNEPLRRALKLDENAPVAENVKMRSILVLPVYATDKGMIIWKNENLFRDPLSSELLRQGRGIISLPGGDLQDLRLIDGENVSKVSAAELKPMFDRYGADEIIIAILQLSDDDKPSHVLLRRLGPENPRSEVLDITPNSPTDTRDMRLVQVSQTVAGAVVQIAASTSESEEQKIAKATQIKVKFIYAIPREYAQIEAAVRGAPGVIRLDSPNIAINNVAGTIYLNGDKDALHKALAAQGIVVRDQDGLWTLSAR